MCGSTAGQAMSWSRSVARMAIGDSLSKTMGGFPFSGCFSQADLEADGKGPLVIKECVRLIDGELRLESIAGRGSRLEITIPQKRQGGLWILNHLIRSELS